MNVAIVQKPTRTQSFERVQAGSSPAWVFLSAVVIFIIYGSIFPFDFQETPKSLANFFAEWHMFRDIADATDNFLLFVPLGVALHFCFKSLKARVIAALIAVLTLGVGIQLVQLYLPSRTASLSDTLWNLVGMAFGSLIASTMREVITKRLSQTKGNHDYFAMLLVLLWFFYESFPFVPTLDTGLLRDHVKSAIFPPPFELMRLVQHGLAAALGGVAVLRTNWLQPRWLGLLIVGGVSVILELFVAYGSLRLETLLGIAIGLGAGYVVDRKLHNSSHNAILILALSAYLITVVTPYRAQSSDSGFTFTPFSNFFWQGISRDIPPTAFEALALGAVMWAGLAGWRRFNQHPLTWIGCVLVLLAILESVRVHLIGLHGDTTPFVLVVILGSFAASLRAQGQINPVAVEPRIKKRVNGRSPGARSKAWVTSYRGHFLWVVGLSAAMGLLFKMPGIPYNVRELLHDGWWGAISVLGLSLTVYGMANGAFWLCSARRHKWFLLFPVLLVGHGLVAWCLLRASVPLESLHDIVGSPVLGWPYELEMMGRYVALHASLMLQVLGAVLCVRAIIEPATVADFLYWAVLSLLLCWPLHLVVVVWAATDNLTELMAGDAGFLASSALASAFFLTCLTASALSAAANAGGHVRSLLGLALVSALGAATLYWLGAEHTIIKYGRVFSAYQFLLSTDREHYVHGISMVIRYCVAFLTICGGLAAVQWVCWQRFFRYKSS